MSQYLTKEMLGYYDGKIKAYDKIVVKQAATVDADHENIYEIYQGVDATGAPTGKALGTIEINADKYVKSGVVRTVAATDTEAAKAYIDLTVSNGSKDEIVSIDISTITGDVADVQAQIDALDEKIDTVEEEAVVVVEKQGTADDTFAATYVIKQNGKQVGDKINIPKDYLVKSATVKTADTADKPVAGYKVGDKYIDFVVNTTADDGTESHIYLLVDELVDVYTGVAATDGISVAISDANEVSATVAGKAIARANITDAFEKNIADLETAVADIKAVTQEDIDALFA